MVQRVLTWEGEAVWTYVRDPEDLPIVVEPLECRVECIEGVLSKCVLARDVAEVEECMEGLCYVSGYIAFERSDEDLVELVWGQS